MWKTGGATEEDYYCVEDMGLKQADVTKMKEEHDQTMTAVYDAVVENHGFVFQMLSSRMASLDLKDPRPVRTYSRRPLPVVSVTIHNCETVWPVHSCVVTDL